jgi:hypothetical protein
MPPSVHDNVPACAAQQYSQSPLCLRPYLPAPPHQNLESKNIKLVLANWLGPQRDMLERSGFYSAVPSDTIFLNLHDAVLFAKLRNQSPKTDGKDAGECKGALCLWHCGRGGVPVGTTTLHLNLENIMQHRSSPV